MENQPRFVWSEKFCTGNKRIDQDHFHLFEQWRKAYEASFLPDDDSQDIARELLNSLMDFSQTHCRDEESLMRRIRLKKCEQHIESHHLLIQKTDDLLEKFRLGYPASLPEVLTLLEDWIENDVLGEDVQIKRALAGKPER